MVFGLPIATTCSRRGAISFEHRQPFSGDAGFVQQQAGQIAAGSRQARNEAGADWIGHVGEHDRDGAALALQRRGDRCRMRQDRFRLKRDQLLGTAVETGPSGRRRSGSRCGRCGLPPSPIARGPAEIPAMRAAVSGSSLAGDHEHPDMPQAASCARTASGIATAAQPTPAMKSRRPHSITSSARASSVGGTSRPSVLAAGRLITNSNLVACMTGKSDGLAPWRMRPA